MKKSQVLVVDADPKLLRLLRAQLLALNFAVQVADRGEDALPTAAEYEPDLILLALSLPGITGVETCRRLREWTLVPIIVLNDADTAELVEALNAGADDCVTKPFVMAELLARMRAVLRRANDWSAPAELPAPLSFGNLTVDMVNRKVTLDGLPLHLTPTEYELLRVLASYAGRVMTHRELLSRVWGPASGSDTQYLHVFISQLRRKLQPNPDSPHHIVTEPGVGYFLNAS